MVPRLTIEVRRDQGNGPHANRGRVRRFAFMPEPRSDSGWSLFFQYGKRFGYQQRAFAFHAPAVAGQIAVTAHAAMAGNRHRQGIGDASMPDGTHRSRRADTLRDLGISRKQPNQKDTQSMPDSLLKRRAALILR